MWPSRPFECGKVRYWVSGYQLVRNLKSCLRSKIVLTLGIVFFFVFAAAARAQEKDGLMACIEEVKRIREKEGPQWYTKNKRSYW